MKTHKNINEAGIKTVCTALILLLTSCASIPSSTSPQDTVAEPALTVSDLIAEGDSALRNNDIDTAQINYALAIERNPKNVEALYKLATVHNHKDSLEVAEKLLRHALTIDKDLEPANILLGKILTKLERIDEAASIFQQTIEVNAYPFEALNGLGIIHDMSGGHEEAQELFTKALRIKSRSPKVTNNLGYSFYLSGNFREAERLYLEALKFDSNYDRAWSNLALLYSRTGRLQQADMAFRKIVPDYQAANNIGYIGLLQGDNELAHQQFKRAIDTAPIYYELANRNLELLSN